MSISLNCPKCGKLLKVSDSAAGKTGKCPGCSSPVKIPAAPAAPPEDDFLGGMDASEVEETGREVSRPDRKPCPMCGEMIKKDARRCKYCGEDFDTPAVERPKKRKRPSSVEDDEMTAVDWFLCICCSNIGCIIGIVRLCQGKTRSGTTMIVVAIIMNIIGFVIGFVAELAKQAGQ